MIIQESGWRDLLRLFIWYPFRWFCQLAPIPLNLRIFRLMGHLHFQFSQSKKRALAQLLESTLPEGKNSPDTVQRAILDYFSNHYTDRMSIFHYARLNRDNLDQVLTFDGLELIDQGLEKGRGCVLLHSHMGPSQLSLVALGRMGYGMTQMGFRSEQNLSGIGRDVQLRIRMELEEAFPAQMLYADRFQRQIFRNLKDNGVIMTAGDGSGTAGRFGPQGVAEFMGRQMVFPVGPYKLAEKTGATLLFLFLIRDGLYRYRIVIRKPDPSLTPFEAFVRELERHVADDPGQWPFWDGFKPGVVLQ
ncbi:MAG: lysophospholipid acyltransferase family protein [Magnetococcales bacterium]|nr:lysophospholipid acyltransferase family protein [Magnetococcales bacterium]